MAKETSGYIGQDNNGKWFARITFKTENGKRKNVLRKAKDKAQAKKLLRHLINELENSGNNFPEISKIGFNELADYYEENFVKEAMYIDERKVEGLRDMAHIKLYVRLFREFFGSKKLKDICYADLYSYKNIRLSTTTIRGELRSIGTVNRELTALRRIFNIAIRKDWMRKNPFHCGEPLIQVSAERRRERILTLEEETRLLKACETSLNKNLRPFLISLLSTGCRKSEMLKLKWCDIDFEERLITIQALNTKSLQRRTVAIPKRLYDELIHLWDKSDKELNSSVFGIKDNVRKSFSAACKEAGIIEGGIHGLNLHSLRHTVATRLVKGQLPIQLVGRILGHTQPQTTYRYLTADNETTRKAASILESFQEENY
jgi:integrase